MDQSLLSKYYNKKGAGYSFVQEKVDVNPTLKQTPIL